MAYDWSDQNIAQQQADAIKARRTSERGPRVRIIQSSDIGACPKSSLLPAHYRDDGTCRCDEED